MPDDYRWPEGIGINAQFQIIGNGWACVMAHAMAHAARRADPDAMTVVDLFCGGGLGALGWLGRYWRKEDG